LVRSSISKIFRPEANKSGSLALSSVQGANTLASERRILLYSPAFVKSPAKRMRQRLWSQFLLHFQRWRSSSASEMDAPALGSQFLLPFQPWRSSSATEMDAPASGSQFLPPSSTLAFLKRQRNGCASVREPISASLFNAGVPQALPKWMRQR
jgi:hypothetical protein